MDEFSFIDKIKQETYKQPTLLKGVGDDGAVFKHSSKNIVTVVDTFVEGVHFSPQTMTPYYYGYRALAANISDLAAMGAIPAFYLVSIVVPKTWIEEKLIDVYTGMKDLASTYQMDLIGGDTVAGNEFSLSITALGYVEPDITRYRNKAEAGDIVFVTGTLGDSQAGLHILQNSGSYLDGPYFIQRHRKPSPRIMFSRGLRAIPRIALNDISDGIANEAAEIALASNVDLIIQADALPVKDTLDQFPVDLQRKWMYFGGEDFELIGTVDPIHWSKIQQAGREANVKVTKIGHVEVHDSQNKQVYVEENNERIPLEKDGYIHLR